ncbi:MAG: sensor domain-containing diguanylate cyclase [Deltaproteobacteria bacterium]|nr:sensor domain-containing diguanylate cyclase [Deltaproteobacteria bacterium]
MRLPGRHKRGNSGALKRKLGKFLSPSASLTSFLSFGPLLVVTLSFYTVSLVQGELLPGYAYLFMALLLAASGIFGLRSSSPAVLAAILLGEVAAALGGMTEWWVALANAGGLLLAATGIPLVAKARVLALAAKANKRIRDRSEARLSVGERLARGTTPNPSAAAGEPVSNTESLIRNILLPAKKALRCRTAIFFWYNEAEDSLIPVETLSDCTDLLTNTAISVKQGRLSGLKSTREPLTLRFSPGEAHSVPIYRKAVELAGVMAVPVYHKGQLAGAFVFDRSGVEPFFLPDNVIARRLAEAVEDALVTERRLKSAVLLSQQFRMMDEAARQFSAARAFEQVYDTAVRYAVAFSPFTSAVLAHRVTTASDEFEIVGVSRKQMAGLLGKRFSLRNSLADLAARNRTSLPPNFVFEGRTLQPFGPDVGLEMEDGDSCLLVPLQIRDETVGFLLLADNRKPVLRDELSTLHLFADYCAVSLVNAEANKELERMAVTDPLTAIPNQRAFRTRMIEAAQRADRSKKAVSLLFVDIDRFKSINDTHGHPAGDAVLRGIARCLSETVRKVDFVARYGGEEFVVLLEETAGPGALVMAERLRQKVAGLSFPELGSGRAVTVSIGIASYPNDAASVDEVIALADAALYRAKNEGRNQCQSA